jgi:citrate synthase
LDGEEGILRHRGYSIEDLAAKASFLEVAYLLLNGELPTRQQFDDFDNAIREHTLVNEGLEGMFKAFPTGSHPMGQLNSMISALGLFYPKSLNPNRPEDAINRTVLRLHGRQVVAKAGNVAHAARVGCAARRSSRQLRQQKIQIA